MTILRAFSIDLCTCVENTQKHFILTPSIISCLSWYWSFFCVNLSIIIMRSSLPIQSSLLKSVINIYENVDIGNVKTSQLLILFQAPWSYIAIFFNVSNPHITVIWSIMHSGKLIFTMLKAQTIWWLEVRHSYNLPKTLNAHRAFTLLGHCGDSAEHISNKSSKEKKMAPFWSRVGKKTSYKRSTKGFTWFKKSVLYMDVLEKKIIP